MKMLLKVSIMTPTIKAYIMHMDKNVINLSSSDDSGDDGESGGDVDHANHKCTDH